MATSFRARPFPFALEIKIDFTAAHQNSCDFSSVSGAVSGKNAFKAARGKFVQAGSYPGIPQKTLWRHYNKRLPPSP